MNSPRKLIFIEFAYLLGLIFFLNRFFIVVANCILSNFLVQISLSISESQRFPQSAKKIPQQVESYTVIVPVLGKKLEK